MSQGSLQRLGLVKHFDVEVSAHRRSTIGSLAEKVHASGPRFRDISVFGPNVRTGFSGNALLAIEDHSCIQLAKARAIGEHYSYRIFLLAGRGDLVAVGGKFFPEFERYVHEVLNLGCPDVLSVEGATGAIGLAEAATQDPHFLDRAGALARETGGLTLLPYMASGWIWRLASLIAERSGLPVEVAGPPPWLTEAANDKLWFAQIVEEVLGSSARPAGFAAYNMTTVVGFLRRLIHEHGSVAIKMTSSASSIGNLVLDSKIFSDMNPRDMRDYLHELFEAELWPSTFPLQVMAWESPLLASPSVQIWIPGSEAGPPVVEGVFDQSLEGPQGRFIGGAPSQLPADWQQRIASEGTEIALLLQHLGYFGRCSFDAILVGSNVPSGELHWVECNGRWGGISLPMSIVNRLYGDWKDHPFVTVIAPLNDSASLSFGTFLESFDQDLLRPGSRDSGIVLLTPGSFQAGQGLDLLVCAETVASAKSLARSVIRKIAAGSFSSKN